MIGPDFSDLQRLNNFRISQIVVDEYMSGYDTDCYDYSSSQSYKTRSDCIMDCYYEGHPRNEYDYHLDSNFYMISSYINSKFTKREIEVKSNINLMNLGYSECHRECNIRYYRIDSIEKDYEYGNGLTNTSLIVGPAHAQGEGLNSINRAGYYIPGYNFSYKEQLIKQQPNVYITFNTVIRIENFIVKDNVMQYLPQDYANLLSDYNAIALKK